MTNQKANSYGEIIGNKLDYLMSNTVNASRKDIEELIRICKRIIVIHSTNMVAINIVGKRLDENHAMFGAIAYLGDTLPTFDELGDEWLFLNESEVSLALSIMSEIEDGVVPVLSGNIGSQDFMVGRDHQGVSAY